MCGSKRFGCTLVSCGGPLGFSAAVRHVHQTRDPAIPGSTASNTRGPTPTFPHLPPSTMTFVGPSTAKARTNAVMISLKLLGWSSSPAEWLMVPQSFRPCATAGRLRWSDGFHTTYEIRTKRTRCAIASRPLPASPFTKVVHDLGVAFRPAPPILDHCSFRLVGVACCNGGDYLLML
jgi:hypothetical protein